ncbi:MAG: prepilin-type N-terminal cleavage/methylation domain-containing protein [Candidatus Omnitrophica bacterium]|nr:prepilin-type N-terminal cleavage/methylation domain-containing protein [Candidatus Omnitrophota bacterium]MBU4479297.1 prepilin-type N-terminal cleavage/methylation domain-containing protein [Candidatus Omnitrophota bacterium]MCG2704006.1 prepilin-type N-terminal cleavage/methylation domain-containing protein [Candidatus Omnitrophota bacterium]
MKPNNGFTLMELMLTVMVIAILVSIAIPSYISTVERTRAREALSTLESMRAAEMAYSSERRQFLDLPVGTAAADNQRWQMVGLENPNLNANRSWSYSYSAPTGTAARLGGPNNGEIITLNNNGTIDDSGFTP